MSWNVEAFGRPEKVAAKLALDFERIKCAEPEESIKNHVAQALMKALDCYPPENIVQVRANGSQYAPDQSQPDQKLNTLSVTLSGMSGFVE